MAKIDTLFMTKTPEKTLPFGAACTYIAHIRENPPPGMCTTLTDGRGGEKVGKGWLLSLPDTGTPSMVMYM